MRYLLDSNALPEFSRLRFSHASFTTEQGCLFFEVQTSLAIVVAFTCACLQNWHHDQDEHYGDYSEN